MMKGDGNSILTANAFSWST